MTRYRPNPARTSDARQAVCSAFDAQIARARAQVARARTRPASAVLEQRKAIRRAIALAALLRPALGAKTFAALRAPLREALAETSALRDEHALRLLLAGEPRAGLSSRTWGHLHELMHPRTDASHVRAALRNAGRTLAPLPRRLRAGIPDGFDMDSLARLLQRGYRRARRQRARLARRPSERRLHRWRKRVKELRFQLRLLGSERRLVALRRRLGHLCAELGEVTDLLALGARMDERAPGSVRRELRDGIDRELHREVEQLLSRSAVLFTVRPRDFGRRAARALAATG